MTNVAENTAENTKEGIDEGMDAQPSARTIGATVEAAHLRVLSIEEEIEEGLVPSGDEILDAMVAVGAAKDIVKEIEDRAKSLMLSHVKQCGPLDDGTHKHFASKKGKVKCVDVGETCVELVSHTGGDMDLSPFLSAQPFKPAAVRRELGEELFNKLFTTEDLSEAQLRSMPSR